MIKKILLSLSTIVMTGVAMAQVCVTNEVNDAYLAKYPGIKIDKEKLEAELSRRIANRGTADTATLDIPVVVHVMHDYGTEYVTDDQIYTLMNSINELYNKQNASLANVIPPFIPLIGNGHIHFHLATKDPGGNATHGITRHRTYLTQGGDDQAKLDYWPQSQYLNIWLENHIGMGAGVGVVAAYSAFPYSAGQAPYYDGIIANASYLNTDNTIPHEIGHSFSLFHPWNSSNQNVGVACGDDGVDDTPPTKGHFSTCNLFDTDCAIGNPNGPDTTNVQNVMDYSSCTNMFTQGQVDRMRTALRSTTGNRSNLWTTANLAATGALAAWPALPPVADFSVSRVFYAANNALGITFYNRSWNDTVTAASWTFTNGASSATSTQVNSLTNTFTQPGWVTVSLTATSAHGSNTTTRQAVYVADPASINAAGYTEDFTGSNASRYPAFDYYNTGRKWEAATDAGYNDNASMRYVNSDTRSGAQALASGTPKGDYSDFFTAPFDLTNSAFANNCYLTFMAAGAYRNNTATNDVLEVSYSKNAGLSWTKMDSLTGGAIANNGIIPGDFKPTSASQWAARNLFVPSAARVTNVYFRFRYRTGANNSNVGNGNNYYIDHINFAGSPTAVTSIELENTGMEIAPNPTTSDAFILLKGAGNGTATVIITDITGKNVYHTEAQIAGDLSRINIPSTSIYAKGMYVVKVIAGTKIYTRKLVVN